MNINKPFVKCCSQGYCDCFAYKNGYCTCLEDTDFPENSCPFYKEKKAAQNASVKSLVLLLLRGRFDLIRRYHSAKHLSKTDEEKWI